MTLHELTIVSDLEARKSPKSALRCVFCDPIVNKLINGCLRCKRQVAKEKWRHLEKS